MERKEVSLEELICYADTLQDELGYAGSECWNTRFTEIPQCSPNIIGPKDEIHYVTHGMRGGCGVEARGGTVGFCCAVLKDGTMKFAGGHKVGECPFLEYKEVPKGYPTGTRFRRGDTDEEFILGCDPDEEEGWLVSCKTGRRYEDEYWKWEDGESMENLILPDDYNHIFQQV